MNDELQLDFEEEDDETVLSQTGKRANTMSPDPSQLPKKMKEEQEWITLGVDNSKWKRPPVTINPAVDDITIQQMDVDYSLGNPVQGFSAVAVGPVPFVRLFGVTEAGNSVMMHIHGAMPYFWVPAPPGMQESQLELFRQELDKELDAESNHKKLFHQYVLEVSIANRQSIMGYSTSPVPFLRITLASPKLVPTARSLLQNGRIRVPGYARSFEFQTYESDIPFVLRWMIDCNVVGANWVCAKAGTYKLVGDQSKVSLCQIEIVLNYKSLISHSTEGPWAKIGPLRILSFDIECSSRPGTFPDPDEDKVIQIANYLMVQGEEKPLVQNIFCLNGCSSITGAQVISCKTEREMLDDWTHFLQEADPDIITGYNIGNFDLCYLMNRANKIKAHQFPYLGRLIGEKSRIKDTTFSSRAYGRRDTKSISSIGRVQLDMLQVMQRDHKLRSYSLNAVSAHFLGEQKEDVHYSIITDLFEGTADDRRRLAIYCLKDAYLPLRLMRELLVVVNYLEMARVTGIPVSYILTRGQQIKVISQLYRKAMEKKLVIPTSKGKAEEPEGYAGAHVISPILGFYQVPISTLDFSSLYPSIMMAHNLCYTTILSESEARKLAPTDFEVTPSGDKFVKAHVSKGLLPMILEELLAARSQAKKDMAKAEDPALQNVLNGRQLALKVTANSVYGFTGATIGKLPCLAISASVTAYGRNMIEKTKELVEKRYCIANGATHDAQIIYGDTDSVMIKFGTSDLKEAMDLGLEAADYVTEHFQKPISLAFEKVYHPYLLISKKRYAGLLWTKPEKYDKLEAKGIVTVRRDNCPLVKDVIDTCLKKILIEKNPTAAEEYAKAVISDLLRNKLDLSLLVITKALSKSEYAVKQAHTELASRMRSRDPGSAPNLGDRVPYVITKGTKGSKSYEKAEDPLFALEHNIPLDTDYYLHHQLANPLMDVFSPILKNPASLINGEHTRSITIATPTNGLMGSFTIKQQRCLGCNSILKNGMTVCQACEPQEGAIYQQRLAKVTNLEQQFGRVWTQCQNCQGSFHQPVLCSSRDCPIFYMRKKVQKDLKDAQIALSRFNLTDW